MHETPTHLKFGYEHMVEMQAIHAALVAEGVTDPVALHFMAIRRYVDNHKNDPTMRERQAAWIARQVKAGPSPLDVMRAALIAIRDGHNDPRTLAREVLAANPTSPHSGDDHG